MSLKELAKLNLRSGREFMVAPQDGLRDWAAAQGLPLRQAMEKALEQGIFPEVLESNFPHLTPAQQLTLWRSSALVAGLGGLGGCQAMLLARAGVGRLYLADGDSFEARNFNRQLLATTLTLGQNKALVTARYLREVNAGLIIEAIPEFLDQGRLREVLPKVGVMLDGLDTLKARRELFATAKAGGVPVVHGAVWGFFGQVTTIMPQDPPEFVLSLQPAHSGPETAPGVLAPAVTLTASLQAHEAIRLLLGKEPCYHRRLAHFDGDTGHLEFMRLG
jgi:molybdopterin/thiamine biosynthesis adenylyltransferase